MLFGLCYTQSNMLYTLATIVLFVIAVRLLFWPAVFAGALAWQLRWILLALFLAFVAFFLGPILYSSWQANTQAEAQVKAYQETHPGAR